MYFSLRIRKGDTVPFEKKIAKKRNRIVVIPPQITVELKSSQELADRENKQFIRERQL
jgi:hypothetical protein